MAAPTTATEAITQNMLGPKSVSIAGQSVTQHSVDDQIKAAVFLASQNAALQPHFGLRFTRLIAGPRE